ncbi:hypothetical protein KEM55_007120 [Ascosphaera atra]|nr:hypothetical protein KEM55_007120 [Ascosphaera atra]
MMPRKSKKKQKQQQPREEVSQPEDPQQLQPPSTNQTDQQEMSREDIGQQESAQSQAVSDEQHKEAAESNAPPDVSPAPQPLSIEEADNHAGEGDASPHPFEVAVRGGNTGKISLEPGNSLSTDSEAALADMQATMREYDDPEGLTIGNRHFDCVEDYVRFMASLPVETFETFLRADKMAVGRAETYLSIRKIWNSFGMEHAQKVGRWSESGEITHSEWAPNPPRITLRACRHREDPCPCCPTLGKANRQYDLALFERWCLFGQCLVCFSIIERCYVGMA